MSRHARRRTLLQNGLALGASALLPQARACEYFTSHLRVTHPWTRATAHDADAAVVCMKFDEVSASDRLVLVESPICTSAEMGGPGSPRGAPVDFFIAQGQESFLEEAGTHVRLLGLKFPLEVGRSYPLRLGFEKGGAFQAVLSVDFSRFT